MALGSLLLFLALLLIVALIIARPLIEGRVDESASADDGFRWLAERERVLDALAELDADSQLGKVPEEIYGAQRQQLLAKGVLALEELEKANRDRSRQGHKHTSKQSRHRKEKGEKGDYLEELIVAYKTQRKGRK
ncbi:MAG: hypothetical protein M1347_05170 [Chloroflexi bacterium]|nr:hypothetical protein [Chloroflexota bacterium]